MKIYNKGKRSIQYAKGEKISPDSIADIKKEDAEKLMKLFKGEIITLEEREVSTEDVHVAEIKAKDEEIESLKAEIESLKANKANKKTKKAE